MFWCTSLLTMSGAGFIDPNNCALNAHGNLKNASDIQFYDSEQDKTPISSVKGNGWPIFKECIVII